MTSREPITFKHLCVMARGILQDDPTIDNGEWAERIKELLVKAHFQYPEDPEMLTRAMTQVEHALKRTLGPRPLLPPPSRGTYQPPAEHKDLSRIPAGWDIVQEVVKALARAKPAASATTSPPPAIPFGVEEGTAVDLFWRTCREEGVDRLAILKACAELAVIRPSGWDYEKVRREAQAERRALSATECFTCRHEDRPLHWHHIIQIQHGGSNYVRNRVAICDHCHRRVHPWLPKAKPDLGGWSQLGR